MHGTSRAERLTTCLRQHDRSTTTPQPFMYPERRHQPVAGRRHAPWAEIVKLPTRYMYFLFFSAFLSLCMSLKRYFFSWNFIFVKRSEFYDSPVCRKASSPGPEGLKQQCTAWQRTSYLFVTTNRIGNIHTYIHTYVHTYYPPLIRYFQHAITTSYH